MLGALAFCSKKSVMPIKTIQHRTRDVESNG
jgi:hypothetical protein